ncbi:oleosin 16.4 kDa [Cajanus cajan]|uniref:Oleosin 5 n=1 Tax=Cajanus cajan TaxID=3821 RepID=A0A151TT63_CAJCA|nr:oleosin 16.4 kDa [Cajanus cajan]KYP70240.1 Oleosin 5 [Cajanus cajan]
MASSSNVVLVSALVPLGATLLTLGSLTLTTTIVGLALVTPLFVIFSPVLVPALLLIAVPVAVAGFLTSGALGITSLSSFAWLATFLRPRQAQKHTALQAQQETR